MFFEKDTKRRGKIGINPDQEHLSPFETSCVPEIFVDERMCAVVRSECDINSVYVLIGLNFWHRHLASFVLSNA